MSMDEAIRDRAQRDRRDAIERAERAEAQLGAIRVAVQAVEAMPCIDRRLNTDWVSRREVLTILRAAL